jgi:hypothetical protein
MRKFEVPSLVRFAQLVLRSCLYRRDYGVTRELRDKVVEGFNIIMAMNDATRIEDSRLALEIIEKVSFSQPPDSIVIAEPNPPERVKHILVPLTCFNV